jgi:Protein of unknown function (DUF2842)
MDYIMSTNRRTPSWRKPAGILAILAIIAIWSFLIASASPYIGQTPILVQAFVYLVAGIVWIAPLRPLLIWMETGSFKAPPETR